MARPLQDGSRAEPTAAVSRSPAFPVGGTVAMPSSFCQSPLALSPRVNCIYRWGRGQDTPRSRSSDAHGDVQPATHSSSERQEAPTASEQRVTEPNGHLPTNTPSLEQAIGARLRHMGDQFHQEYEQRQQEHRPHRALWGHFCHFVFQLLGTLYNLPMEGMAGIGPN